MYRGMRGIMENPNFNRPFPLVCGFSGTSWESFVDAKNDYLLVLNNTLTKSTNKLIEMSSVCDSNIVVTKSKGGFLTMVCWVWLLPRPQSASFFNSNFSNQEFPAWNQLQRKYSHSGNEQMLWDCCYWADSPASFLPYRGPYLGCYQRLPGST